MQLLIRYSRRGGTEMVKLLHVNNSASRDEVSEALSHFRLVEKCTIKEAAQLGRGNLTNGQRVVPLLLGSEGVLQSD